MPRRSPFTEGGRRRLQGAKRVVRPRGVARSIAELPIAPVYRTADNDLLNQWESTYAWACVDLGIEFIPQQQFGPPRQLGSLDVDFYHPAHFVVVQVEGPWHFTTAGRLKNYWRRVHTEFKGFREETIEYEELFHVHRWILDHVGTR